MPNKKKKNNDFIGWFNNKQAKLTNNPYRPCDSTASSDTPAPWVIKPSVFVEHTAKHLARAHASGTLMFDTKKSPQQRTQAIEREVQRTWKLWEFEAEKLLNLITVSSIVE